MSPLNTSEPLTPLQMAAHYLSSSDVIGIPTETVYGLAARISDLEALSKVFAVKERPFFDPLIVHIADVRQWRELVTDVPPAAQALAEKFWPGPLTIVLPKAPNVSDLITAGLTTVAVRLPAHPMTRELIRLTGPLAAPSANKFGKTSPTRADHVRQEFGASVFVLDGGSCEVGIESTVVGFTSTAVQILRPGAITPEQIRQVLAEQGLQLQVERAQSQASPGHTEHHYQPAIPLYIVETDTVDSDLTRLEQGAEFVLPDNPQLAARQLYGELRRLAETGKKFIYVRRDPLHTGELWEAIWDRLERASSENLEFKIFHGSAIAPFLEDLGRLRLEVFREPPYLYDGDLDYEKKYLQHYQSCPQSYIVLIYDRRRLVGAATALPLEFADDEFKNPLIQKGYDAKTLCYFGESLLKKNYRQRGLGKKLMDLRLNWAHTLQGRKRVVFCTVQREGTTYESTTLTQFWRKTGFKPLDDVFTTYHWRDIGDNKETSKVMQYWMCDLKK